MKSIKKFWQDNRLVLSLFVLWRVALFGLGFLAFRLLTFKASFPFIDEQLLSSGFPQWLWHWGNFDGVHFLAITRFGYGQLIGSEQVFFPLFPVIIKLVTLILPNYFLAAFLVSNFSFLVSAIIFRKLVKRHFNPDVANWATLFLFLFPTSFFFGSIYTESLFLFLILAAFYFSGLVRALFSFLAGLTRLVGAFVWWGASGTLAYIVYLWVMFNKPFYFLNAQGSFANGRANSLTSLVTPPQVLVRYLKIFITASPGHYDYWIAVLEFSAFIFGIGMLLWLTWRRKVPVSWLVFSWAALVLPSFSGTLSSMPRYLLTVFPIFIGLGLIKNHAFKYLLAFAFLGLQTILTVLFVRGYWVS